MELLELFAKAIAPQLLNRIFDNVPQSAILFAVMMFFAIKYLLKWNKARIEKLNAKEARSNQILQDGRTTREDVKLIREENQIMRKEYKQDKIDVAKQFKEIVDNFDKKFESTNSKINKLDKRILTIEVENQANSKQESAVITMLNRIINSIDKK